MKVADVMTTPVVTVAPDAPWKQVAERMLDAGVSGNTRLASPAPVGG